MNYWLNSFGVHQNPPACVPSILLKSMSSTRESFDGSREDKEFDDGFNYEMIKYKENQVNHSDPSLGKYKTAKIEHVKQFSSDFSSYAANKAEAEQQLHNV
jgi:hypothetical protein